MIETSNWYQKMRNVHIYYQILNLVEIKSLLLVLSAKNLLPQQRFSDVERWELQRLGGPIRNQ